MKRILPASIELAITVAVTAHLNQKRKSEDLPFITHPFAVGIILSRIDCPEEVIAAGILHDTVEDAGVTPDEIRRQLGSRVADIVEGASEPGKSLSWEERKTHTVESLKAAPLEVKMVVCADKLHNVKTIARERKRIGERVWDRFNRGKEKQEWYYRSLVESLSSDTDHKGYRMLLAEYRLAVEELFKD
jgi:(p)ppGpp synthase/HD superfamily hydrolase